MFSFFYHMAFFWEETCSSSLAELLLIQAWVLFRQRLKHLSEFSLGAGVTVVLSAVADEASLFLEKK